MQHAISVLINESEETLIKSATPPKQCGIFDPACSSDLGRAHFNRE